MISVIDQIPDHHLYPSLTRFDIINILIKNNKYERYLEIGVQGKKCFNEVDCKYKKSVDPDINAEADYLLGSDEYFNQYSDKYDIIFIDGLHEANQVLRDIKNSLNILSEGGTIVTHDCIPSCEDMQKVPRITKQWNGDVWKGVIKSRNIKGIELTTVDTDFGCGIITRNKKSQPMEIQEDLLTWDNFQTHKKSWLNIINIDGFNKIYNRV